MTDTIPDVSGRDLTMPDGGWEFDESVAEVFDDMLGRSIPQYDVMRQAVVDLVGWFGPNVERPGQPLLVLDLGSSNGINSDLLIEAYGPRVHVHGVEVSPPMLNAARNRMADHVDQATFARFDLRKGFPDAPADIVLAVLTLQFIPIEYRERIVADVYDRLPDRGVFIVVEKVLGRGAPIDDSMVDTYLESKRRNGYTDQQIDRKRESLEGVLVPITANWNEQLLTDAGFRYVDCFWRWMNFAGWVAIK